MVAKSVRMQPAHSILRVDGCCVQTEAALATGHRSFFATAADAHHPAHISVITSRSSNTQLACPAGNDTLPVIHAPFTRDIQWYSMEYRSDSGRDSDAIACIRYSTAV